MANIQVSEELFCNLIDYFFTDEIPQEWQADEIRQQLNEKLDKLISRELFTKYKRSPSGRKEYRIGNSI